MAYLGILSSLVGLLAGAALPAASAAVSAPAGSFDLICLGAGTGPARADPARPLNEQGMREQRAQVDLWLDAKTGRIHIPFDLFETGRSSGGWYELDSIAIADHQITAIIASRIFGRPQLWISRIDGTMSISGKQRQFLGMCSRYDPRTTQRSF